MDYQNNYNQQEAANNVPMKKPDSYLVWAILCTCLCCVPLGIVSIVYASKVDSLWTIGAYREAQEASEKAKKWAMWGAIGSFIYAFVIIVLYLIFFGVGLAADMMNS